MLGKRAGAAATIVAQRGRLVLASRTRLDHYSQTGNNSTDLYAWFSLVFAIEPRHNLSLAQLVMSIFWDKSSLLFVNLCLTPFLSSSQGCTVCAKHFFPLPVYVLAVKKSCKLMWHLLFYAVRIIHSCRANSRPINNLMQRKRKKKRHAFDTSCKTLNALIWRNLQKCFSCQRSAVTCVIKNAHPAFVSSQTAGLVKILNLCVSSTCSQFYSVNPLLCCWGLG